MGLSVHLSFGAFYHSQKASEPLSLTPSLCSCCRSHCRILNVFQMKLPKRQHKISIKPHQNRRSKESFLLNHISCIDFCVGSLDFLSLSPNELLTPVWLQHYSVYYYGQTIMGKGKFSIVWPGCFTEDYISLLLLFGVDGIVDGCVYPFLPLTLHHLSMWLIFCVIHSYKYTHLSAHIDLLICIWSQIPCAARSQHVSWDTLSKRSANKRCTCLVAGTLLNNLAAVFPMM